ncbi:MAG: hypothetical protein IPN94_13905 [Sphingobacteriales bacterium]|nr:hypothetical protein [Sphingobacteriales bacterium]
MSDSKKNGFYPIIVTIATYIIPLIIIIGGAMLLQEIHDQTADGPYCACGVITQIKSSRGIRLQVSFTDAKGVKYSRPCSIENRTNNLSSDDAEKIIKEGTVAKGKMFVIDYEQSIWETMISLHYDMPLNDCFLTVPKKGDCKKMYQEYLNENNLQKP